MAGLKFLRMVGLCCGVSLLVSAPVTAWQDDCTELLGGNCTPADSAEAKPAKRKEAAVSQVSAPPKASPKVDDKPVAPPKPKPVQVAEAELAPPEARQAPTESKAQADMQPVQTASVSERTEPAAQVTKRAPSTQLPKQVRIAAVDPGPSTRKVAPRRADVTPVQISPAAQANARKTGAGRDETRKPSPEKPEQSAPVRFAALSPAQEQPRVKRQVLSPIVPVRSAPQPVMSPTIEMMQKPQRVEIQIVPVSRQPLAVDEVFQMVERQAESACGSVLGAIPATHPEWLKCIGAEVEYRVYRSGDPKLVSFFESLLTFNR